MIDDKYYGNYIGYVLSNNSPLKDGTVQVFVPSVNGRIFKNWVNNEEDQFFKMSGVNIASLLTPEMIEYLQQSMPWARVCQPIIGSGSSGYVNQQVSTVADGNWEELRRAEMPEQTFSNEADSQLIRDGKKLSDDGFIDGTGLFDLEPSSTTDGKFSPKYPTTAYNESGIYRSKDDPGAVGAISSGVGDFGGKSYGTYQFASQNSEDIKNFVNWNRNPFGPELQKFEVGSPGFDAKWKELALRDNLRFGQAQETFHETQAWTSSLSEFQRISGITLEGRSTELRDLITGSVNQYRGLTSSQASYLSSKGGNALTDKQIGLLLQDYKLENVDKNFRSSSPRVRAAVANRIRSERQTFEKMSGAGVESTPTADSAIGEAKAQSEGETLDPESSAVAPTTEPDHVGSKAATSFEYSKDAFSESSETTNNKNANPTTQMYNHTNYSNMAKGSISLPQPGAHVWVFFEGGNPNVPVVFGYHYGEQDIRDIWDVADSESPDYPPATPEDFHTGTVSSEESSKFRNKFVVNERGGSIDVVSTTGRERVKISHFKGSHLEFNPIGENHYVNGQRQSLVNGNEFHTVRGHDNQHVDSDRDVIVLGNLYTKVGDIKKWTPTLTKMKDLLTPIHEKKRTFELQRAVKVDSLDQSPIQVQVGEFAECPVCQKPHSRVVDNEYTSTLPEECPSCGSTGVSPSTQDGLWEIEPEKEKLRQEIEEVTPELSELEKELALENFNDGGSHITFVANDKVDVVGLVFNDMESHRKDVNGKFVPYALNMDKNGVFPDYKDTPLIESVHVDPLPGGDWTMMAGNKMILLSGSNGMQLKTLGRLDLFGTIANIAAEQLNISSRSETVIDGGNRLDLTGDVISLRPRPIERNGVSSQSVIVDANLGVSKNMIVSGAAHIDGGIYTSHITAPVEEQYADMVEGVLIGYAVVGSGSSAGSWPVISVEALDAVKIYNIPLYLPETHGDVRERAAGKVTRLFPSPPDKVSEIRRVAEVESEQFDGADEPFINEHGDGSEESIDSGTNFENEIV